MGNEINENGIRENAFHENAFFEKAFHENDCNRENEYPASEEKSTFKRIYDVVRSIPYGKVVTYGQVANLAGNNRWSRVVGYALHSNPDPEHIPCYRVVNRFGEVSKAFAFGGANRQVELLEAEGVECKDGKVDLDKFQWNKWRY